MSRFSPAEIDRSEETQSRADGDDFGLFASDFDDEAFEAPYRD